jgi:anaerobic selenocysteine-containing dehydrogenase
MTQLTRRSFLAAAGASAAALPLLDQITASAEHAIDPRKLAHSPHAQHVKVGACDMCGAQCPVFLQVEDGRVVATYANAAAKYSAGKICGKAHAGRDKAYHPGRITRPMMRRAPGRYEPVSWDEAIDFMAGRLARIAERHGENAVHVYMGLSSQPAVWTSFWKTTFGTKNVFGNDSVCDGGRRTAGALTLGDTRPLPDLEHTRVGLVFGADYLASTKYLWYPAQMLSAMANGARFYVVDPRFSETAARAVQYGGGWLPIRPGTDAALALAMAHVIFAAPAHYAEFVNPAFVQWSAARGWHDGELGLGVDRFAASVTDKTPEWAETVTGIPAATTRRIADELMRSEAPMVDAWTGLSHYANGVYAVRAAFCLAGLVNAIDRKGGLVRLNEVKLGQAGAGAVPGATYREVGHPDKLASACGLFGFVRSDCNSFVPQAMLDPKFAAKEYRRRRRAEPPHALDYPVKAFITATRNFANGNSGSPLWRRALRHLLEDPEGLVVDINLFISEQGAFSHLILPEAGYFERDDLLNPSSLYPTVHVRRAVVPPAGESRTMFDISRLLADGLAAHGFKGGRFSAQDVIPYASYLDMMKELCAVEQPGGERIDFAELLATGVWQARDVTPRYGTRELGWSNLGKFTRTFDFYSPALAGEPAPADKLHPQAAEAQAAFTLPPPGRFSPVPVQEATRYAAPTAEYPFQLVTCGRNQWNSASKTVHLASCVEKEPTNLVTLHPGDAGRRGIHDGDRVLVTSVTGGEVIAPARLSEGIRPGTVHLANGYGQDNTTEPLARRRGANVNELTDPANLDPISGAEGLAEMLVRVERVE